MKRFTLLIALRFKVYVLLLPLLLLGPMIFAGSNDVPHHKKNFRFADITVKGKVTGKDGPLAGVTVAVEGSSTSTITDANGSYTIIAPENGTLIFSYTGYNELRIAVKRQTLINVSMVPGANQMDEVIVV